jgi:hypothetical protein
MTPAHIATEAGFVLVLAVSIRVLWLSFKREWLRFLDAIGEQDQ